MGGIAKNNLVEPLFENALFLRPTFITNAVSFSGLTKHLTYPELELVYSLMEFRAHYLKDIKDI